MEERIEVKGRRRRRRDKLVDDLREVRGYWKSKEEAIDCTLWRTRFGGYGPVAKRLQNECVLLYFRSLRCCQIYKTVFSGTLCENRKVPDKAELQICTAAICLTIFVQKAASADT